MIDTMAREEGLWSLISMSSSVSPDVQRHAARAFFHLARKEEAKSLFDLAALRALLKLTNGSGRDPQSKILAHEAIKRLLEDEEMEALILEEKGKQGDAQH